MIADDEYQFEESTSSDDVYSAAPAANPLAKIMDSRIMLVVGAIVVGLVVYKLLSTFFAHRKPAVQKKAPVVATAPAQPIKATDDSGLSLFSNRLNALESHRAAQKSTMATLQQSAQTTQQQISQLSQQLAGLQKQMQQLTGHLSQQHKAIVTIENKLKPVVAKKPHYRIQAIVPGRAWLKNPNGSVTTVRIGSKLEGYGSVRLIDAQSGVIYTSDGSAIGFGSKDS